MKKVDFILKRMKENFEWSAKAIYGHNDKNLAL